LSQDLDRKIIAVIVKSDQPEWFTLTDNGEDIALDNPPEGRLEMLGRDRDTKVNVEKRRVRRQGDGAPFSWFRK